MNSVLARMKPPRSTHPCSSHTASPAQRQRKRETAQDGLSSTELSVAANSSWGCQGPAPQPTDRSRQHLLSPGAHQRSARPPAGPCQMPYPYCKSHKDYNKEPVAKKPPSP